MRHPFSRREFHVSRDSRQKYGFHDLLFSLSGNVIFADYHAARVFTHQLNLKRDLITYPEQALRASDLYAMGLIDEILHYIIQLYCEQVKSTVMNEALEFNSSCYIDSSQSFHRLPYTWAGWRCLNIFPNPVIRKLRWKK
jgi:hypothetical protein